MTPVDIPRLIRAPLFVPAHRRSMVDKAILGGTSADALIVDLEDGVPQDARAAAVEVMSWLASAAPAPVPAYARIRSDPEQAADDIKLVPAWFAGVILAKAEQPEVVAQVAAACSGRPAPTEVWLLIESALGLERLHLLLDGRAEISGLMLGAGDLRADLRARTTEKQTELLYARSRLVTAAAAFGLPHVIDTPEAVIDSPDRLQSIAGHVRDLGFTGKACIHPSQVAYVQLAFLPSDEELAWARRVMSAADGAQRVDGELVDQATKRLARTILASVARGPRRTQ